MLNLLKNPNGDGNTVNHYLCSASYKLRKAKYTLFKHSKMVFLFFLSMAEGLDYWQLTENGGFGWQVEEMPREGEHAFNNSAVTKYFSTSYE